jgi:hypothetical protein
LFGGASLNGEQGGVFVLVSQTTFVASEDCLGVETVDIKEKTQEHFK